MRKVCFCFLFWISLWFNQSIQAQCVSSFGPDASIAQPACGAVSDTLRVALTHYGTIGNLEQGGRYRFTAIGANFISIRQTDGNGALIGFVSGNFLDFVSSFTGTAAAVLNSGSCPGAWSPTSAMLVYERVQPVAPTLGRAPITDCGLSVLASGGSYHTLSWEGSSDGISWTPFLLSGTTLPLDSILAQGYVRYVRTRAAYGSCVTTGNVFDLESLRLDSIGLPVCGATSDTLRIPRTGWGALQQLEAGGRYRISVSNANRITLREGNGSGPLVASVQASTYDFIHQFTHTADLAVGLTQDGCPGTWSSGSALLTYERVNPTAATVQYRGPACSSMLEAIGGAYSSIRWQGSPDGISWTDSLGSADSLETSGFTNNPPYNYYRTIAAYGSCADTSNVLNHPVFAWYLDADADHYYTGTVLFSCTSPGASYYSSGILGDNDCNDNDPDINPAAAEICGNGIDDNCNTVIDDGCIPASVINFNIALATRIVCPQESFSLQIVPNGYLDSVRWYKNNGLIPGATGYTLRMNQFSFGVYRAIGYVLGNAVISDSITINRFDITADGGRLVCADSVTVLRAPQLPGYSYEWLTGALSLPSVGSNDTLHLSNFIGNVFCRITSPAGCAKYAKLRLLPSHDCPDPLPVMPKMDETAAGWIVYPNPGNGIFTIEGALPFETATLEWFDIQGRQQIKQQLNSDESGVYRMDATSLAPGTYFLHVRGSSSNQVFTVMVAP